MNQPRVFIASSFEEFKEHRRIIDDVLREHGYEADEIGRLDGLTLQEVIKRCESRAAKSDLLVLLVGERWGAGVTEKEFQAARRARRQNFFIYFSEESRVVDREPSDDNADILRFRQQIADFKAGLWFTWFPINDTEYFRDRFREDFERWMTDMFVAFHRRPRSFTYQVALFVFALLMTIGLILWMKLW